MAQKRHLTQYDSSGNKREIYLNDDEVLLEGGQTLKDRLAEMQEGIEDAAGQGGIQQETDPTVPSWAKQPVKPTYTPQEVGAVPAQGYVEYTQAEKEKLGALPTASELSTELGEKVKSVSVNDEQPVQPDQNGNVHLEIEGGEGKSAYQSYLDTTSDNPKKTEAEWVASLKGPKGDTGNVVVSDGVAQIGIINDLETGGEGDALSAGMGKMVAGREATDRQRIDAIVAILKKSVFTDDQTTAFAALDALANGIDSISFNTSSHKFTNIGDTFTLSIVTDPAGKTAQVTWATSNASVATVSNGVVTAVADGNATITATTTDGKVAVCKIEVATIVITGLSLNKSTLTLNGNDANETLVATTTPTGYESGVQWSSSDPTKATVDNNGKVTAVANTAANTPVIITASIGGQTATCQVTVTGVMQTFHISIGTLTNVTLTDGNDTAITDNQSVTEGSQLTLKLTPASGMGITSLSITMGDTDLSSSVTTDANGVKTLTILSVDGDIDVSATAGRVNLLASVPVTTGYGCAYQGETKSDSNYSCKIVEIEFGKRYSLEDYNWRSFGAESPGQGTAFRICIAKSDGNGGYATLKGGDTGDFASSYLSNAPFNGAEAAYIQQANSTVTFDSPSTNDLKAPAPDKLYFVVNTRFVYQGVTYEFSDPSVIKLYEVEPSN